jgi:hypothetical protein
MEKFPFSALEKILNQSNSRRKYNIVPEERCPQAYKKRHPHFPPSSFRGRLEEMFAVKFQKGYSYK